MNRTLIYLLCIWLGPGASAWAALDSFPHAFTGRARVIVLEDPQAVHAFIPQPERVREMVRRGLTALTGTANPTEAWKALLSPDDMIGIKVYSLPGSVGGTRPAVVAAVVEGLIEAGFPPGQIIIWDRNLNHLHQAGFGVLATRYNVELAGATQAGFDENAFYETALLGRLVWSDLEFESREEGAGRKSHVTRLLTERITRVINVTPLLNHNAAGVSGNLYSLALGSVDNAMRFEFSPTRLAFAVPELYAVREIGDRVVLNIVDGLICQYEGEDRGLLHYSSVLGQLRFSSDPVALDVLSMLELERQRERAGMGRGQLNWKLYGNATLLELGVSDPRRIEVLTLREQDDW